MENDTKWSEKTSKRVIENATKIQGNKMLQKAEIKNVTKTKYRKCYEKPGTKMLQTLW